MTKPTSSRWTVISPSQFPWEQEALEHLRRHLPQHEPYCAFANFELVLEDGTINEIDVLLVTPAGLFLVEIKSWAGALRGDSGTWHRSHEGKVRAVDNPRLLANLKAKRLKSRLAATRAFRGRKVPFVQAVVFLSALERTAIRLDSVARVGCFVRRSSGDIQTPIPGLEPLASWQQRGPRLGAATAEAVRAALEEIGIRPSQRQRRVSDYALEELIDDRGGWQDWRARHVSLPGVRRRVRIYHTVAVPGSETRETLARAAQRELLMLQGIEHPGILRPLNYTEHELGPALLFPDLPQAKRLDHYLTEREVELSFGERLQLVRDLTEIVDYAHRRRLVHRSLSPRCVYVLDPDAPQPALAIADWHSGARIAGNTGHSSTGHVSGTVHPERLIEEGSAAYMAPELRLSTNPDGIRADVFSLGALAYRIFTGRDPAATSFELIQRLQERPYLDVSTILDGCPVDLDRLVTQSTQANADQRWSSTGEVLEALEQLEDELTAPEVPDPETARRDDVFPGGYRVRRRLGQGSTSFVFLVERGGKESVLKVARTPEHNRVLAEEAGVLEKLRHHGIVELYGTVEIGDRTALEMARAGTRTLAEELRVEGRLSLDFLERFGEDLLGILQWLEERGISHRDIKPANLGIQAIGPRDAKHLVLFDFSLSRAEVDRIDLGTPAYLDPFLRTPGRQRWDLAAERFAVAMTLHEMATGQLPSWGSGATDPLFADGEAQIHAELFYPGLRRQLAELFTRALAREAKERFDNAEEMLRAWRRAFRTLDTTSPEAAPEPATASPDLQASEPTIWPALLTADPDTGIADLGLSTRAFHALERLGVTTAAQVVGLAPGRLSRMRGVGGKTRQELVAAADHLRTRLGAAAAETPAPDAVSGEDATARIDRLAALLIPKTRRHADSGSRETALRRFLGLDREVSSPPWPNQTEVAQVVGVSRARVSQFLVDARSRWRRIPSQTAVRSDVATLLEQRGGVTDEEDLAAGLLAARGSSGLDRAAAHAASRAVVRAATEVERQLAAPRWTVRRGETVIVLATVSNAEDEQPAQAAAQWALRLGERADQLAHLDPLPSPESVLASLREEEPPEDLPPLDDARLIRLAATCSRSAAVSSRRELYPRGMAAVRALTLAAGVAHGLDEIAVTTLQERVRARYPEAEPLPDPPQLDRLIERTGLDLSWNGERSVYEPKTRRIELSATSTLSHVTRTPRPAPPDETLAALDFDRRLDRSTRTGGWLVLLALPQYAARVVEELTSGFPVTHLSLDTLILAAMRETAAAGKVDWRVVLAADATKRTSRAWINLQRLVERALPAVEERLLATPGTVLLTEPGLLGRYERLDLLERLRDCLAAPDPGRPLRGLWILVPSDDQSGKPRVHDRPLPVVGVSEWVRIPESWVGGAHRVGEGGAAGRSARGASG